MGNNVVVFRASRSKASLYLVLCGIFAFFFIGLALADPSWLYERAGIFRALHSIHPVVLTTVLVIASAIFLYAVAAYAQRIISPNVLSIGDEGIEVLGLVFPGTPRRGRWQAFQRLTTKRIRRTHIFYLEFAGPPRDQGKPMRLQLPLGILVEESRVVLNHIKWRLERLGRHDFDFAIPDEV